MSLKSGRFFSRPFSRPNSTSVWMVLHKGVVNMVNMMPDRDMK